jgi:hypothetical protein
MFNSSTKYIPAVMSTSMDGKSHLNLKDGNAWVITRSHKRQIALLEGSRHLAQRKHEK